MTHKRIFLYVFLLNSLLFFLQLIHNTNFLFSSFSSTQFQLPWISYQLLFYCLLSHLVLLLIFTSLVSLCVWGLKPFLAYDIYTLTSVVWGLAVLSLFMANQLFYPQSEYAILSSSLVNDTVATCFLVLLCLGFIFPLLYGIFCTVRQTPMLLLALLLTPLVIDRHATTTVMKSHQDANIIIIGIDSLRLNKLTYAPVIKDFLTQSHWFNNASTPLARTFPAWTTILTGLYPNHHGVRFNLIDTDNIKYKKSLAWNLKKRHYQTLYATDEKRFSHIDTQFGFDTLIGPKTGANDFIQSKINDMPLVNVIINTTLGKRLFPYNYNNRASYVHYYPGTFNKELDKALNHLDAEKPLLLSMHLTLTHWPLVWGETPPYYRTFPEELYPYALTHLDKQFKKIMLLLKKHHLLSHSIIILLSDHGDAVLEPHSRLTEIKNYQAPKTHQFMNYLTKRGETLNTSFGHGTDLLSPKQYRTLLAFRFSQEESSPKRYNTPVSLVDIKATLLDYLNAQPEASDGISLRALIENKTIPDRFFFSETGFDPLLLPSSLSLNKKDNLQNMLLIGKTFYYINKINEQLLFKKEKIPLLIQQKQLSVRYKDWLLALYPNDKGYLPVLINTKSMQWTDALNSPFAKNSPASTLLARLEHFYLFLTSRKQFSDVSS